MLKIGAIILAAGASKRMGSPKLLLALNQKPLFQYSLDVANSNGLFPTVLVVGALVEEFQKQTEEKSNCPIIYNPAFSKGMSTSLKLGIDTLKNQVDAVFIFLADQPFVPNVVVQSILEQYKNTRKEGVLIVRPSYKNIPGHPVLIDAKLFAEFNAMEGDTGGKEIIKRYSKWMKIVPFENPIWGKDVDTPNDLLEMEQRLKIGEVYIE